MLLGAYPNFHVFGREDTIIGHICRNLYRKVVRLPTFLVVLTNEMNDCDLIRL